MRLRDRINKVGIQLPTVEVHFQDLKIDADIYVGNRALPTLINYPRNMLEDLLGAMHLLPSRKKPFPILHSLSGILKPGRMTLLLGPPGAGKTTLMLALAGKLSQDLRKTGRITYNGHDLTEFIPQRTAAYISQNDVHIGTLTVRETLDFSARVQGAKYRSDLIEEVMKREKGMDIHPEPDLDAVMKVCTFSCVVTWRFMSCDRVATGDDGGSGVGGGSFGSAPAIPPLNTAAPHLWLAGAGSRGSGDGSSPSGCPRKGRWRKGQLLGSGTFGTVFRGYDMDQGQLFAVKEVPLEATQATASESIKQIKQEIALLSQLEHPNIVKYLGTDTEGDFLYIFLEYIPGGSIHKLLQEFGKFDEPLIRTYTRQILGGLAYLHNKNTVHRDIKGANILVDTHGHVKLADFGMAKHLEGPRTKSLGKGSPYWMAPEAIRGSETGYDLAVDIWSLGCTVLEMAAGKPPWSDLEVVAVMFKISNSKDLPAIPDDLSLEGHDFVQACLQRRSQDRPSAAALLDHPFVRNAAPDINSVADATKSPSVIALRNHVENSGELVPRPRPQRRQAVQRAAALAPLQVANHRQQARSATGSAGSARTVGGSLLLSSNSSSPLVMAASSAGGGNGVARRGTPPPFQQPPDNGAAAVAAAAASMLQLSPRQAAPSSPGPILSAAAAAGGAYSPLVSPQRMGNGGQGGSPLLSHHQMPLGSPQRDSNGLWSYGLPLYYGIDDGIGSGGGGNKGNGGGGNNYTPFAAAGGLHYTDAIKLSPLQAPHGDVDPPQGNRSPRRSFGYEDGYR
eukprot:SM000015S01151  [mRNA]  locus=s15:51197:56621:- [translate_table: standard]